MNKNKIKKRVEYTNIYIYDIIMILEFTFLKKKKVKKKNKVKR